MACNFSKRQREVLTLLSEGHARKTVADRLHISINTVKGHAKAAFRKSGAANIAQAVRNYYCCN